MSSHFHFDEIVTFSRRQPPKPLPIRKKPHNRVPTRSLCDHRPRDHEWSRGPLVCTDIEPGFGRASCLQRARAELRAALFGNRAQQIR